MIKKHYYLLLTLMAFCVSSLIGGELETLLDRHYRAMGGLEKLAGVKTIHIEGTARVKGMEVPFTFIAKNDKCRLDYLTKGSLVIKIYDGKQGWEVNPELGTDKPQSLSKKAVLYMLDLLSSAQGVLVNWQEKGYQVQLVGDRRVDGKDYYEVFVDTGFGVQKTLFIDKTTYLVGLFFQNASDHEQGIVSKVTEYGRDKGLIYIKRIQCSDQSDCFKGDPEDRFSTCKVFKEVYYRERRTNIPIGDHYFQLGESLSSLSE